ncbi:cupin domain-containing protein [Tychonema sp. LEGE 07199]|uniref:cupin domain-containing protein n=1 Tax=unclassified Tychonema TaxID=2642144 RepID=UPI00187F58F9|nr:MULTISPECIES: cupin domain-containing protein [unclassified Tychonema]MBE9122754.1 cupin domain-containing protein [Tychonema sp. LEGE 07199]MBE9133450.1 cupin domain-containing protein [Tychonema sp. LEGE 07196]
MEMMPDEEFNMLAAFQVLDTLDESESRALAEKLEKSPELESERVALESAISAIAYTAPPVPVAPDLKNRLLQRIAELPPTPAESVNLPPIVTEKTENKTSSLIVRSGDVKWKAYGVPGVWIGKLSFDKKKREITCLMRLEPGASFPLHRHAASEEVFVLEGDLIVEGEVCHQGDYIHSVPGSIHSPLSEGGCLLLMKSSLNNEMLV